MTETKLENLKLIKDKQIRLNLNYQITDMQDLFIENQMKNGMIYGFFKDCLNGQILISLNKKPDHYVNTISDFYIDDRVPFRGRKRLRKIIESIKLELMEITKRHKPQILVGDIVRSSSQHPSNVVLRDRLENNPNLMLKIVSIELGLDPNYIGYQAVNSDEKPFKKNWIYVGSNDIILVKRGILK